MPVTYDAFESKYGFRSPNFTVDANGNIVANSISVAISGGNTGAAVDFTVSEAFGGQYLIEGYIGPNPAITLRRSVRSSFSLTVPNLKFFIYESDLTTLYSTGLSHSITGQGEDAQGQTEGTLAFTVPLNAPSLLYYGNETGTIYGTINIVDPDGKFGSLEITNATNSTSETTGALTVTGGVGVGGDLYVGGEITAESISFNGVGITSLTTQTNLELDAGNKIVLKINNNQIGYIDSEGLEIPLKNIDITNATIGQSTINNTTIGLTSPAAGSFTNLTATSAVVNTIAATSASVTSSPSSQNSITNKQYVDTTVTALAIALGM